VLFFIKKLTVNFEFLKKISILYLLIIKTLTDMANVISTSKVQIISFTGSFYTLWEKTTEVFDAGYGRTGYNERYDFVKVVSKSKEKTFGIYPNAEYNEKLQSYKRRHFGCTRYTYEFNDIDKFRFGKYRGQEFYAVNDLRYTEWYFTNISENFCSENHLQYVANYLMKHGYRIDDLNARLFTSPEKLIEEAKAQESMEIAKELSTIFIDCHRNLNSEGIIVIDGVTYKFENYKLEWWEDFCYGMPLLDGVGKRLKNKTVKLTDYEVNSDHILVKKFKIKK
jgi:hypothetical protein